MKFSLVALCVLLLMASLALGASPGEAAVETQDEALNGNCCLNYVRRPIPFKDIKSYEWAPSTCPKAGVIFYLKKNNKRTCADPKQKWVQERIKRLPPP